MPARYAQLPTIHVRDRAGGGRRGRGPVRPIASDNMTTVVLAPLTRQLASTIRTVRAPHRRSAMTESILAGAASSWAVLMGIAPVLQIRRMLREQSSRQVSVGYFIVLLIGFLLWIAYGTAAGIPALVIPNIVALLVGATVVIVALRLRRRPPQE
jgi:MtN3 and saliva related transmembrane protein